MQRLGYLFDMLEKTELADALVAHVREHAGVCAPLVRCRSIALAPRSARWRLAINASVEPDA